MIGIYKITNKLTGKSYIGQSIHCGKRFDEHCKGNSQFIDQMIEFDGIENYTFEILKKVEKEELNYWEDYFIIQYDTMYPNGYNKKWNTSEDIRKTMKIEKIEQEKDLKDKNDFCEKENFIKLNNKSSIILSNEDLIQLEKWRILKKQIKNNEVMFWRNEYELEQFKANDPNKIYICAWDMTAVDKVPTTKEELIARKQEMRNKEELLNRPTKYCYQDKDYYTTLDKLTDSQKRKCRELKYELNSFNEANCIYFLNNYGEIEAKQFGSFQIDTQYNSFALHFYNMNTNLKNSWLEMFEKGLIPNENIKIIDISGNYVNIKDIKMKRKLIKRIIFS